MPYLRSAGRLARAVAADPAEVWTKIQDELVERWEHRLQRSGGAAAIDPCPYHPQADWERRLHELLGAPWPCPVAAEFWALWPEVLGALAAKGLRIGRGAFGGWGDGEPGLVRAAWCLARHLRPANVVETGVARGLSSRVVLEALERNGTGRLWSIDLPPMLKPELQGQIGTAVVSRLHHRWSYIKGSSRRRLPALLARLGKIDLFIHDSRHSESNVRFELGQAWAALRPGGALIVDDIDLNRGLDSFTRAVSGSEVLICHAEPLQPDPTRFAAKGLFGIVRKEGAP